MDARAVLVVLLTISVSAAGTPLPTLGDAGTGSDAGDSPANATPLDGPGTYEGILTPPGDADWYVLERSTKEAVCYSAELKGAVHANVTLSLTKALKPSVERPILPAHELDLGITAPSTSSVYLGLESTGDGASDRDSFGPYRFELRTLTFDESSSSDGASGGDAGGEAGSALETEGPCISGSLSGGTDEADAYAFDAEEGEHVALSLAQAAMAPARLTLVSPSNETVAAVSDGGFADVELNETGEWLVKAELTEEATATTDAEYMIGLTVNGPNEPPCKPGCFTSMG